MAEPTEVINDDDSRPEMVEITLDNQTITVPKETAEILKKKEHDLASRNERILAGEREKIAQEKEQFAKEQRLTANNLEDDIEFYRNHPETDWQYYSSKVSGGDGSFSKDRKVNMNQDSTVKFQNDPQIDAMRKEIETVKKSLKDNAENNEINAVREVQMARDEILPKCAHIDSDIATALLESFFRRNKRHPSKSEVRDIIMEKETKMASIEQKKIDAMINAKTQKTSAMPETGGLSPLPKGIKLPARDDVEGWIKQAREDNVLI